jgi:prolipoprotein diacylglyceryl transferase
VPPFVASIPSPSRGVIDIGPLELHAYGLMLALGVLAATTIADRRYTRWGGEPRTVTEIAIPVVVGGARVYHLFTGYDWSAGGVVGALKIWEGGLSIWGAVAGGLIAVLLVARVRRLDALMLMDAIAPGLAVAQAIGRWGNWFNQELFGRPTDLPWGLEIDFEHRPERYLAEDTFHPTFLYESIWCLLVAGAVLLAERRLRLRKGQAFACYVAMYTFGRTFFEALRVDPATEVLGVRFNLLVSAVLCGLGIFLFAWWGRRSPEAPSARRRRDAVGVASKS